MSISDNKKLVIDARDALIKELTPEIYYDLGIGTRFLRIQQKLPTRPIYGPAQIRIILDEHDGRKV